MGNSRRDKTGAGQTQRGPLLLTKYSTFALRPMPLQSYRSSPTHH